MTDEKPISFIEDDEGNLVTEQDIAPVASPVENVQAPVSFIEDGPTEIVAKKEYTEETFHADSQSIADSRLLAPHIIEAPKRQSETQGHHIAVEMAMGKPARSTEDIQNTLDAESEDDPAYQEAYRQSLNDGDFTRETLDWLGNTRWNMVKMGELAFDVGDWSDDEQLALVRLMAQYEELPISWETTKRAAEGLATDPSTYVGLGFVVNALAKLALKPAASAAVKELMKKTSAVATLTGVETAAYTATDDLLQQKIQVDTGQQEGYDYKQTAVAGGVGFGAGFTVGGVLAAAGAKMASRKGTPKSFSEMLDEKVAKNTDEVADETTDVIDEAVDEVDEVVDEVADEVDEVTDADYADEFMEEFGDEYNDDFNMLHDMDSGISDIPNDALPTAKAGGQVDEIVPVEAPASVELPPTTVMPQNLKGAKPRYSYQHNQYGIEFESDVDKALYIISSAGSKSHDEYMAFLRGVFPDKNAHEITLMGHEVKGKIKGRAQLDDANMDGNLVIEKLFEPEKKPRRANGQAKADDPKPKQYSENQTEAMPYNVTKMDTSRDVQNLVLERADQYLDENPRIPYTLKDVEADGQAAARELAETTGGDYEEIAKVLQGDIDELRIINARIKATRDLHVWAFDEMVRLARKHDDRGLDKVETAELAQTIELVNSLVPITMKQSAEQSRTLGSRRTMAVADNTLITGKIDDVAVEGAERVTPQLDDNFIKMVNDGDGKLVVEAAVGQILSGLASGKLKSPRDLKKVMSPLWLARAIKEVQRVRAGSMLSGLTTLSMAFISNFYNAWAEPALHWFAYTNLRMSKKARASAMDDALERTHALAQWKGNMQYLKHGIRQSLQAVWEGKHITDPNVTRLENMQTEGWAGKTKKRVAYEVATGWSHVALLALDELHKSTRAMSLAQADAIVAAKRMQLEAAEAGKKSFKEGSPEWKKFIQEEMAKRFDETGAVTDKAIKRQIQMETYTEELVGPIGNLVNGVARWGHGAGGFVLPFRRAPLNAISYAVQYAPIPIPDSMMGKYGFLNKQKEILQSGDKVAIAKLHARRKVGAMGLGLAWAMSEEGDLTGGGPSNWEHRKAWINAGNKPYSIKLAGEWIPYDKIEPFSTVFGTIANIHYITGLDPERYQKGNLEKLGALQLAVAEVLLNKAYFQSFGDWMKLMTGEDDMTVRMGQALASSFVPNFARQVNADPYVREANTVMEMIATSVNETSSQMGIRYDVLGMPRLKPNDGWFLFKQKKSFADFDAEYKMVSQEILDLRMLHDKGGLLGEPPKNIGIGRANMQDVYDAGSEESVYSKYNRFIGEAEIGGLTLKQALAEAIASDKYQSRPKSVYLDVNSPHVAYLSKIIGKYRKVAKGRLMNESRAFRDLHDDYLQRAAEVKSAR